MVSSKIALARHTMAEPDWAPGSSGLRTMRRVAAGSALVALACAVGVVLGSGGGFDALLARGAAAAKQLGKMPVAVDPAKTEALHWGHKYLKAYGLSCTPPQPAPRAPRACAVRAACAVCVRASAGPECDLPQLRCG